VQTGGIGGSTKVGALPGIGASQPVCVGVEDVGQVMVEHFENQKR
jgi:hypothetical protein